MSRVEPTTRSRVRVRGVVQGVGFRPFVAVLAERLGLSGWVLNDPEGVVLEVQGRSTESFLRALVTEAPPLARVDRVEVQPLSTQPGESGFAILASESAGAVATAIPPDAAVCEACIEELCDPGSRRYRYPFLNCTHCGPRWTLTERLPYDRPQTSMARFALCEACAAEYHDPRDRRFHAQPIACPRCGPQLSHPVEQIFTALSEGAIVALQGLGGYHLVCDARNRGAVARLRARKHREAKPFAAMVAGLASARLHAQVSEQEAALLTSPRRPVVLLRRQGESLVPELATDLAWVGLMLPSTPLQILLFHEAAGRPRGASWLEQPQELALVMTSANLSGEPLVTEPEEARERLEGIADLIVSHDRRIVVRTDDSVARVVGGAPLLLRRARGWVPEGIALAQEVPPVLALGGHLKVTACLTRGSEAFLSQHVGDLDDARTLGALEESLFHLEQVLAVRPVAVAHDLHPDFASTHLARQLGLPAFAVQHHHAHIAAVCAEHRHTGPVLGLALDGFGLGENGESWGGELLRVEGARFERLGHLAELRQPGGEVAARQPWRMAAAALHRLGRGDEIASRFGEVGPARGVAELLERGLRSPWTSSCGRWFDAAAGLLGVRLLTGYEGEAPMVLESLVRSPRVLEGAWRVEGGVLELLPLLAAIEGQEPVVGAELFHGTLAAALVEWVVLAARRQGIGTVALGGGCLANRVLAESLLTALPEHGLRVLFPRQVPPNDGGLSLGQAWVAAQLLQGGG